MKSEWQLLQEKIKERFGETLEIDALLYLIGLQELSHDFKKHKKDDKVNIMHIAICTLLEPYGFYKFKGRDEEGWPHWDLQESVPFLESKHQNKLIVDAIIEYFKKNGFLVI
ncbi:MAG: hypothetical protein JSU07_08980 [Bacteroidetes bacterium]|nr:hypothetical protein [Bacteroidota bacterium]